MKQCSTRVSIVDTQYPNILEPAVLIRPFVIEDHFVADVCGSHHDKQKSQTQILPVPKLRRQAGRRADNFSIFDQVVPHCAQDCPPK